MRVPLCLVVFACASFCGAAVAQEGSDLTLVRREALVREYFEAIEFDKLMEASTSSIITAQIGSLPESSVLTAETREIIVEVSQEVMRDARNRIMDRYIGVYAETLTEPELQALVDFYESEVGRSITAKSTLLAAQSGPILTEIMPEIQADMRTRMCARIKCPDDRR